MAALVTLFHMTTESGGPARLDSIHDARLSSGQHGMVGFAVAVHDVGHFRSSLFHPSAA